MIQPPCPDRAQLAAFAKGSLPDPDSDSVAEHLETCRTCETCVTQLERESMPLLRLLKDFAPETVADAAPGPAKEPATELDAVEPTAATPRDYQILELIGEGGMGAVYRAFHLRLRRTVAIKVLPPSGGLHGQEMARFQRETRVLARLRHPNVVQAMDAGLWDDRPFLVMEYIDGPDLGKVAKRLGPLAIADACEIVRQTALALQHAHEQGIIHRDVKPSNLMLAGDRPPAANGPEPGGPPAVLVKLLDLGLARIVAATPSLVTHLTRTGQVLGTVDYMAPEQVQDSREVDARADLYSLGATLYRLLTGQPPFGGLAHENPVKKLEAICQDAPRPLRELRPEVTEPLAGLVHRLLAKQPAERFASAAEVAESLQAYTAGHDLAALLERARTAQAAAEDSERSQATRGRTVAARGNRGARRWSWVVAAGLLGAAMLAGVFAVRLALPHGELVIETAETNIDLLVKRDGRVVQTLEVQRSGQTISLRAGEYTLEIRGAAGDQLVLEPLDRVVLTRGGRGVVRIAHRTPLVRPPEGAWFVNARAPSDGDGTSWTKAFRDLQTALEAARRTTPGPTQIWIAAGRYTPSPVAKDRSESFRLINGVVILGGFLGGETSADQRMTRKHPTVLSGDLDGNDAPQAQGREENSFHVVVSQGNDATAVLDGVVITGGNADGTGPTGDMLERTPPGENDGGGLLLDSSSSTLRGCVFIDNYAQRRGGGVCAWRSAAHLEGCWWLGNRCGYAGGGFMNHGKFEQELEGRLSIEDAVFFANEAARGGGLLHWWGMPVDVSRSVFIHNRATGATRYLGGGGLYSDATDAVYTDCLIARNHSLGPGGGVNTKWTPQARFVQCTLAYNTAPEGQGGGLFTHNGAYPQLERCRVWGNTAEQFGNGGGAEIQVSQCQIQGGWPGDGNADTGSPPAAAPDDGTLPPPLAEGEPGHQQGFEEQAFQTVLKQLAPSLGASGLPGDRGADEAPKATQP